MAQGNAFLNKMDSAGGGGTKVGLTHHLSLQATVNVPASTYGDATNVLIFSNGGYKPTPGSNLRELDFFDGYYIFCEIIDTTQPVTATVGEAGTYRLSAMFFGPQ